MTHTAALKPARPGEDGAAFSQPPGALCEIKIRAQLHRILASPDFDASPRHRRFLSYVVEQTLAGRSDQLKGYSIAVDVFGRDAAFDAMNDPVVRIEAGRLRSALERYYLLGGREDPIRIDIPKGAYIPSLQWVGRAALVEPEATPEVPADPAGEPLSSPLWRFKVASVLLIALAFSVVIVLAMLKGPTGAPKRLTDPEVAVEVLAFANLSGPSAVLHTAGISEEVLTQLARFRELKVVGRPSGRHESPESSDALVGSRYLLTGGVRVVRDQLRVSARLVDQQAVRIVWSQIYERTLRGEGSFQIEADIAAKVASAVAEPYGAIFAATSQSPMLQSSRDADAYLCALRFYHYRKVLGRVEHATTRDCLEKTTAKHQSYSSGWAMLAYLYLDEDRFGLNRRQPSPAATVRARQAAERAVELDGTNARALQALMTVLFYSQLPDAALEIGAKALALNPNDTEILAEYGSRIALAGDWQRGAAMIEDALGRNPAQTGYYIGLVAHAYFMMGNDRLAVKWIRRSDARQHSFYHFIAALIFARAGLEDDRAKAVDQFLKMRPRFFDNFEAELAMRNFTAGDRAIMTEAARRAGFPVGATN